MKGLSVEKLSVSFEGLDKSQQILSNVSFCLEEGESVCVVGTSGAGKTTLWKAILGLLAPNAECSGAISLPGGISPAGDQEELRHYRRAHVGVMFQDAMGSLVPNVMVGDQLANAIAFRNSISSKKAIERVPGALGEVGFANVKRVMRSRPNELSGGMCQRIVISLALAAPGPLRLLIADEPISSLDTVSAIEILDLLIRVHEQCAGNLVFITHDLRVAKRFDWIAVISNGSLVEFTHSQKFFSSPTSTIGRELLYASQALSAGGTDDI